MTKFYTHVSRKGNLIYYRGYENGERVSDTIPFKPTLYVNSDKPSKFRSLYGKKVSPMQFDSMRDAGDFRKRYQGVQNFPVHGQDNFQLQYIAEKFPGTIKYDTADINTLYMDIEV